MVHIVSEHLLSKEEFESIKGTPLYLTLISKKYTVSADSCDEASAIFQQVKDHCSSIWYCANNGYKDTSYTYYFSTKEDEAIFNLKAQ